MQVKESVNAANLLLVGSQAGQSVSKPQTDTLSSDFASFLTSASETSGTEVKDPKTVKVESTNKPEDSYATESGQQQKDVPDKVVEKPEVASKEKDVPTDSTDSTMGTVVSDEPVELTEEETGVLLALVGQLLQNVMTQFHLSMEELSKNLESFDMTMEDLFTKDGLKDFFLQMNSAEVPDLIVDENLNQELNSFLGEFEEVLGSLETLDNLENLDMDLESLLTDVTADMELSDFPEMPELVQHAEAKPQELLQPKGVQLEQPQEVQPELVEEPEVIVTETEIHNTNDQEGQSKQQAETSKETMPKETEKPEREWERLEPQKTFTNPILQAIENAVDNVQEIVKADTQPVRGADIINQIVEQVRIQMNQDTTSLEMQLYPEHLGKIQIHVVSKDGVMAARIVAETEAAKQAIENGLTNLKESMQEQNLKVDAIEVMVSTTGFERGNEGQGSEANNQTAKGRRKLDLSEPEQDITEEEAAEEARRRATGSSVSYTA